MPSSPRSSPSDDGGAEYAHSHRYSLTERKVELAGRAVSVIHPSRADALIDVAEFERDERLLRMRLVIFRRNL